MVDHVYFMLHPPLGRVKIGFTHNLIDRHYDHQGRGEQVLRVLGVMEGGYDEEQAIHRRFAHLNLPAGKPRQPGTGREWFKDDPSIREFVADNTRPWDGSDVFRLHQITPTLAMHGSVAWMEWLESAAGRLGLRPGAFVEQALQRFASEEELDVPPHRW